MSSGLELISLHIKKTAGITFRTLLRRQFGKDHLAAVHKDRTKREQKTVDDYIHDGIKVLHGHWNYKEIEHLRGANTRVIAWVRNPIQRVISNYHYTKRKAQEGKRPEWNHRPDFSLEDYIEVPALQNLMSRSLEGIAPENMDFIGVQEFFDEDIKTLIHGWGWKEGILNKTVQRNTNDSKRNEGYACEPALYQRIHELNRADMDLYHKVLQLRDQKHFVR